MLPKSLRYLTEIMKIRQPIPDSGLRQRQSTSGGDTISAGGKQGGVTARVGMSDQRGSFTRSTQSTKGMGNANLTDRKTNYVSDPNNPRAVRAQTGNNWRSTGGGGSIHRSSGGSIFRGSGGKRSRSKMVNFIAHVINKTPKPIKRLYSAAERF